MISTALLALTPSHWRRLVIWVLALAAAVTIVIAAAGPMISATRQLWDYASMVGWSRVRICACRPDEDLRFRRDDGLAVAASVYRPDRQGKSPGLLLVHGNTPLGRQLPVYKVLATKLAERGYVVLTMDMTGYGESDDPFQLGGLEAIENESDVSAALHHLRNLPGVDRQRIFAVGHSAGTTPVLAAGIADPSVKKIVAFGPPRRLTERLLQQHDRDYFWRRAQKTRMQVYGSSFPDWFTSDVWLELNLALDISRFVPYLSDPGHKPILLIDGELENEHDRTYLRDYHRRISEPKHYETIPESDHYANTRAFRGLVLYDQAVVGETVEVIDRWLRR